ncbi:MAG: hypothetical protein ACWA5Q_08690 [bacterium]
MPRFIIVPCLLALSLPVDAAVKILVNPDSGLRTWVSERDGFSIELIQLLPDFIRAIYASHGFPREEVERIAGYCVFGTIVKNTSDRPLHYAVKNWQYIDKAGMTYPVKTKTEWFAEWQQKGIGISWTLLPDEQVFQRGDWQQGFTTIGLKHGDSFDLRYSWKLNGQNYTATIEEMACAPAELPET